MTREAMKPEPFGYFKAEPFGWTDCAPTDEGSKALYEYPPEAPAWHDAPTCAGIWLCDEGAQNLKYSWRTVRVTWPLNPELIEDGDRWYGPIPEDTGATK